MHHGQGRLTTAQDTTLRSKDLADLGDYNADAVEILEPVHNVPRADLLASIAIPIVTSTPIATAAHSTGSKLVRRTGSMARNVAFA
jgi:hypothetical protein